MTVAADGWFVAGHRGLRRGRGEPDNTGSQRASHPPLHTTPGPGTRPRSRLCLRSGRRPLRAPSALPRRPRHQLPSPLSSAPGPRQSSRRAACDISATAAGNGRHPLPRRGDDSGQLSGPACPGRQRTAGTRGSRPADLCLRRDCGRAPHPRGLPPGGGQRARDPQPARAPQARGS